MSASSKPNQLKELTISPGRLGLNLTTMQRWSGEWCGVVILEIDPSCTFRDKVQVGDRIVSVDGRVVKRVADLLVGRERVRKVRILRSGSSGSNDADGDGADPLGPSMDSVTAGGEVVQNQKQETGKETAAAGKRKRRIDDDVTASGEPQSQSVKALQTKSQRAAQLAFERRQKQKQQFEQEQKVLAQRQLKDWNDLQKRQQEKQQQQQEEEEQQGIQHEQEFQKWQEDWNTYRLRLNNHYSTRYEDGWNIRFQQLQQYKQAHIRDIGGIESNYCVNLIPLDYRDPNDLALGQWARLQRNLYWEGKLDQERVDCLLGEGFVFEYDPEEEDVWTGDVEWDSKLKELIEFKKKFLHTDVPAVYPSGQTLGQWVKEQRDLYDAGTLDEDRHVLLEEMGFKFEPGMTNVKTTIIHEAWMRNYKELVQFKRDHGHLEVPRGYKATISSANLCAWIDKQKRKYRQKKLSKNKLRLFEELGLDLTLEKRNINGEKQWDSSYNKLLDYREEHGHVNVPKRFGQLGTWVRLQRHNFKRGQLLEDRKRRLLEIGFDFDPLKKKTGDDGGVGGVTSPTTDAPTQTVFESRVWHDTFEALKSFVETNGHAKFPSGGNNDIYHCLDTWLEEQNRFFEEDKLPERQIQMLEELGINLSVKKNES